MGSFAFGALEHGLRGHISVIDSMATDTYNSGVYIFDKADSNLVSFKNCRFNLHAGPSTRIHTHCGRFRSQPENTDTGTICNIQFEHCEVWDLDNRYWLSAVAPIAKVHNIFGSITVHSPHPQKGCQARLASGAHIDVTVKYNRETGTNDY